MHRWEAVNFCPCKKVNRNVITIKISREHSGIEMAGLSSRDAITYWPILTEIEREREREGERERERGREREREGV